MDKESIWDRLFDCPIPMNRMARIVSSKSPWWAQPLSDEERAAKPFDPKTRQVSIADYVSIMHPPPMQCNDYRGRRSRFHIVCGFAYQKRKRAALGPHSKLAREIYSKFGGRVGKQIVANKTVNDSTTVWYCLRADGEVIIISSEGMRKKLRNLDASYEEDVLLGYSAGILSSEWETLDSIPIDMTPANNARMRAVCG